MKRLFKYQATILALLVSLLGCSLPAATSTTIFYVSTFGNDGNNCRSVRAACRTVQAAVEKAASGDTIRIGVGTYFEPANQILLDKDLVVRGEGRDVTFLTAAGVALSVSIVDVQAAEVRIQDLTIGGVRYPSNPAIYIQGVSNVVLERVTVQNNVAAGVSLQDGTLTVIDCLFQMNARGLENYGGVLQIRDSTFRFNSETALYNSGLAAITNSIFTQNSDAYFAIQNDNSSGVSGGSSSIGILTVTDSSFSDNGGGGLSNLAGRVTVTNTSFINNGIGLFNQDGVLTVLNSVVMENRIGIDSRDSHSRPEAIALIDLTQTALVNNQTDGLHLDYGVGRLTNVTVSGNAIGLRIDNSGNLTLTYSTIAANAEAELRLGGAGALAILQNSIIDGDCTVAMEQILLDDASARFACNATLPSDSLRLGPLALAAGTFLHPLQDGSAAIDAATGACPAVDQRAYGRPYDGNGDGAPACDVGAYEFGAGLHLEAATPGTIIILPTDTAIPGVFTLTPIQNANCRAGPGVVYPAVNSVLAGQLVTVLGKNEDGTWWYSQLANDKCWISNVAGTPSGDLSLLPIIVSPPTPVPTETEVVADPDDDGDGYPFSKDCNDKDPTINPGEVEIKDDLIDSNCNGDDNT